nr:MAG TPA: hypothetical protein [Caudoviricetes sp.]
MGIPCLWYFSRWALTGVFGCFKVQGMENNKTFTTTSTTASRS